MGGLNYPQGSPMEPSWIDESDYHKTWCRYGSLDPSEGEFQELLDEQIECTCEDATAIRLATEDALLDKYGL
jgi:hypothetical protein